ncbi:MAG: hypothetical protein M4579_005142 [Chaenotheca gracillima]|nr:MAG: hypothetical protein M4579_005142 [Chaenotheca gracillima]
MRCEVRKLLWLGLVGASVTQGVSERQTNYLSYQIADFDLLLDHDSQTLVSLKPRNTSAPASFDFFPFDMLDQRSENGNHQFGDITFRVRKADGSDDWTEGDSAQSRKPVRSLNDTDCLTASNLGPTLPSNGMLDIKRSWVNLGGGVGLTFEVTNLADATVEIGSLGMPIISNSIITGREAEDQYANCSFADPNFGLDGGYVRVTRINGQGPALTITPMNADTSFEGWNFLHEPMDTEVEYQSQTFEGLYEWQPFSKAWAEKEWNDTQPWNEPTSLMLEAGETKIFGLRVSLVDEIENIEENLQGMGLPTAMAIPGFIIPTDLEARLYLNYGRPIKSIETEPKDSLSFMPLAESVDEWQGYTVNATSSDVWGRVRATITYADNMTQSVHYYVTESFPSAFQKLGNFHSTTMLFNDTTDPFHRYPAPITYDREVNQQVTQDNRTYVSGIDDEGGAGAHVALAGKQLLHPNAEEVQKYLDFINQTMWGYLQYKDGGENRSYGVIKSLFYYDNTTTDFYDYDADTDFSTSWNTTEAHRLDRSYDYAWVCAAYWSMYRVTRSHTKLATIQPPTWYLTQAAKTIAFMAPLPNEEPKTGYADLGLMGDTTFGYVLDDLVIENMTDMADDLRSRMKRRADLWNSQAVPFGSEQSWDNTGQEGVYYWSKYFGYNSTAAKTLQTIIGYAPTVNHWGYDGNARRYWDFVFAGKLRRFERQLHHYGSAFNSLPVLSAYKASPQPQASSSNDTSPDPLYLLRLGYAGMLGSMSNIDQEGFASAAFHAWPDTLKWDGYSADYGMGLWGMVLNSVTILLEHPTFGWLAYGGNIETSDQMITLWPRDVGRRKLYIAAIGLEVGLDAGVFDQVKFWPGNGTVEVTMLPAVPGIGSADADNALLTVQQMAGMGEYLPENQVEKQYGAWKFGFGDEGRVTARISPVKS